MKHVTRCIQRSVLLAMSALGGSIAIADETLLDYRIEVTTVAKGYDGRTCWMHARAGANPPAPRLMRRARQWSS